MSLLAISSVSANEDITNQTVSSDIGQQNISLDEEDVCQSVENQDVICNVDSRPESDKLSSSYDDWWGWDYVEWYEGNDEVYPTFEAVSYPKSIDDNKITFKLTKDNKPLPNIDLAIVTDHDYKITKLTTDSKGIAVYNIKFSNDFNFLAGFWYNENRIANYMNYNGITLCIGAVWEINVTNPPPRRKQ